ARVADEGGGVADDQDRLVAQFLKLAELPQRDGVAEVDVEPGRVDAVLDAQGLPGGDAALQFLAQLGERLDLLGPALDQGELVSDGFHGALRFGSRRTGAVIDTSGTGRRPRRHGRTAG